MKYMYWPNFISLHHACSCVRTPQTPSLRMGYRPLVNLIVSKLLPSCAADALKLCPSQTWQQQTTCNFSIWSFFIDGRCWVPNSVVTTEIYVGIMHELSNILNIWILSFWLGVKHHFFLPSYHPLSSVTGYSIVFVMWCDSRVNLTDCCNCSFRMWCVLFIYTRLLLCARTHTT